MKHYREGKLPLRSYKVEVSPLPKVDSKIIRDTQGNSLLRHLSTNRWYHRRACGISTPRSISACSTLPFTPMPRTRIHPPR